MCVCSEAKRIGLIAAQLSGLKDVFVMDFFEKYNKIFLLGGIKNEFALNCVWI